jgi:uncharacterized RDD family membrane protein YckC
VYCGTFVLDPNATVVVASRLSRLWGWVVNALIMILTLGIGWVIWWFIVAPRGQNPGKALVGTRVIRTDGRAARTGWMFVRGLLGAILGLIPFFLDELWLLWDRDTQTLHDKLADTVVVRAQGSEHVVEQGSVGDYPAGVQPPPAYEPPVSLPSSTASAGPSPAEELKRLQELRDQNLITEEEYEAKRKAIIDRL